MKLIKRIKKKFGFVFKLNDLLEREEKRQLWKVLVVDICKALFQAVGILSVLPFMNMVMDSSVIESTSYLRYFYDLFNFSSLNIYLFVVGLLVLLLLIIGNLTSVLSVRFKARYVWNLNHRLSTTLLEKYLSLPYSYFLNHNSADLGKNILVEVMGLTGNFLMSVLRIVEGTVLSVVLFIMLIIVNPLMTLITLFVLGTIYVSIYLMLSKRLKRAGKERLEENRKRFKSIGEALGGIKFIKVLGSEKYFFSDYSKYSENYSRLQSWYDVIGKTPRYIMEMVAFGGVIALVLYFIWTNKMDSDIFPLLALFAFAGYRLMPALQTVYDAFTGFRFNRPILDKIHYDLYEGSLVGIKADLGDRTREKEVEFKKEITLEKVSFSYDGNRKKVLEDIEMNIGKDMSVGIVGTTGSGKTTLVDIILGLLTPTEGNMYVDSLLIQKDNIRSWQSNLGYVPQEIFLSDNSITKNIAFGYEDKEINMEEVKKVAKMANINHFIEEELPDGYDTIIGERGVRLSGGQRQRIGIARALYHNPEVLIFDEATSSLDNVTEKSVIKAIERVSELKTMIVIAHRLTTVENCDIVYLIDKGRIVDKGKYNELRERNEKFKEMVGRIDRLSC